ncbi:MAG: DUF3179 domain-containing protein [Geminicoccaceae bacterium]|nr:DUF3179 domain-containing protein [Geminicoccaceae bacterium]
MRGDAKRSGWRRREVGAALALLVAATGRAVGAADERLERWRAEWPRTDFGRTTVPLAEIRDGGPPKDGIPPIDRPLFLPVASPPGLDEREPVIGFGLGEDRRAYPLRYLLWHEIVNDEVDGLPVAVTYCPLCNTAIVFDRRVEGRTLDFGTTGKLRRSDLVMYDRQSESWWQQYTGEAIVGAMAGRKLAMLPARLESWAEFRERAPEGRVLVPENRRLRPYGLTPYAGYDSGRIPLLYDGPLPEGVPPLARVVVVGERAWALDLLRERGRIEVDDLVLSWHPGQLSVLDAQRITASREVGSVRVQRRRGAALEDVVHFVTFAFVFEAFVPDGRIEG